MKKTKDTIDIEENTKRTFQSGGSRYGLLGPSGCGKTTLLSCLVTLRSLNSGEIQVLGHEPGSPKSGVPGPQIGYMPQELALYGDFTIKETLTYFGRLYKLKPTFMKSQLKFLTSLLDLPTSNRYVKTLSGGQQRRVSFAVALFHDPDLLILDEPTVGVDPVLRRSIWNHLVRQSVDHGKTVIVTTHYIEEARQANTIGLMRCGRLLVEDSPDNLLRNYGLSTLEDVFLQLSRKENSKNPEVESTEIEANMASMIPGSSESDPNTGVAQTQSFHEIVTVSVTNLDRQCDINGIAFPSTGCSSPTNRQTSPCAPNTNSTNDRERNNRPTNGIALLEEKWEIFKKALPSPYRVGVLVRKNYLVSIRFTLLFIATFFLPATQTYIFNLCIGQDMTGLKMAIVNDEIDVNQSRLCNNATDCSYFMLSCRYLRNIKDNIIQVPYENLSDALEAGRNGQVWGVIHFGQNFTEEFEMREDSTSKENIIGRQINITMDSSNQQIDAFVKKWLGEAYGDFLREFMGVCGYNPEASSLPVEFVDPVYGQKDTKFTEFMAPGLILSTIFSLALLLGSDSFVRERMLGLVERSLVAGVKMNEVFISYLAKESITMIIQTLLLYVVLLFLCDIPCRGSVTLAIFITFLEGFSGMCFGMMIASICDTTSGVIYVAQSYFLPKLFLSGLLWPIEAMPVFLQYVACSLPTTYASVSLGNVLSRGWGLERPEVYFGILTTVAWIFGFLIVASVVLRLRKYSS
ncbi:ABC transporter G family member 20-like isoform X2 [Daphnia pulex]|uniref:ABC transporter G family member 20-like isoform X2 n=1 Tax=Daphnia pulex TaxID=6669 RepID=UPI001EDDEAA5|nr:ABC transporter G family member 20-like isoform X2 [Daphnia pulex]